MNECYMEQLVPRKVAVKKDARVRYLCIALTLLMLVLTTLIGLFIIGFIGMVILDIYLIHTHYGDDIYNLNLKCYGLQS